MGLSEQQFRVLSLCDFTGNMVRPWVEAGARRPASLFEVTP